MIKKEKISNEAISTFYLLSSEKRCDLVILEYFENNHKEKLNEIKKSLEEGTLDDLLYDLEKETNDIIKKSFLSNIKNKKAGYPFENNGMYDNKKYKEFLENQKKKYEKEKELKITTVSYQMAIVLKSSFIKNDDFYEIVYTKSKKNILNDFLKKKIIINEEQMKNHYDIIEHYSLLKNKEQNQEYKNLFSFTKEIIFITEIFKMFFNEEKKCLICGEKTTLNNSLGKRNCRGKNFDNNEKNRDHILFYNLDIIYIPIITIINGSINLPKFDSIYHIITKNDIDRKNKKISLNLNESKIVVYTEDIKN